jgi:hypothetical protein
MYRFPLEPLMRAAGCQSNLELARCTGFTARSVVRWASQGMSANTADKAAVSIGSHPINVWGFDAWWWAAVEDQLIDAC